MGLWLHPSMFVRSNGDPCCSVLEMERVKRQSIIIYTVNHSSYEVNLGLYGQ